MQVKKDLYKRSKECRQDKLLCLKCLYWDHAYSYCTRPEKKGYKL